MQALDATQMLFILEVDQDLALATMGSLYWLIDNLGRSG